jgi:polysaccharide deacetylase family protein (PEP-CTERM system associated)
MPLANALTIDVEDYFQVSAFASHIPRSEWPIRECRVERNIDRILTILDEHDTCATFFTLGWIAERYPEMVRRIVTAGHEIASHGYGHERASDQTPESFYSDINVAKLILEDLADTEVRGYRAPSFSIGEKNMWAFECLERAGYQYSSSIYPIRHDHYGMPNAPRHAHRIGNLLEIPPTTVRFFNRNWPASGGGYFRLMPYGISRWMIRHVNTTDKLSAVFYFHPWEIDPEQPRIDGISAKTRFRHYVNIEHMENRLRRLLSDFSWWRMDDLFLGKA